MIKLIYSLVLFLSTFYYANSSSVLNSTSLPILVADTIPGQSAYLSDHANVFNYTEQRAIDSLLHYYDLHDSVKMIVFTLDASMTTKEEFDNTVNITREAWANERGTQNGIGIGFSKDLRKLRISTGRGILGRFTDEEAQTVIDETFIPAFKQGKYYEGFIKGLQQIVQKVKE